MVSIIILEASCPSHPPCRYLVHVLLQQLPHPLLQPVVGRLLDSVLSALMPSEQQVVEAQRGETPNWPALTQEVGEHYMKCHTVVDLRFCLLVLDLFSSVRATHPSRLHCSCHLCMTCVPIPGYKDSCIALDKRCGCWLCPCRLSCRQPAPA
jgi:hypothetical protein